MTTRSSVLSRLFRWQHIWAVAAIVGLLCINVIKDPGYLSITYSSNTGAFVGNLVDIARASAPLLMIATGMCLVIAHGRHRPVGRLDDGRLRRGGDGVPQQCRHAEFDRRGVRRHRAGARALCACSASINGILISVVGLQPFITTLVMMLAGRGVGQGDHVGARTPPPSTSGIRWIANGYVLGLPVVFLSRSRSSCWWRW